MTRWHWSHTPRHCVAPVQLEIVDSPLSKRGCIKSLVALTSRKTTTRRRALVRVQPKADSTTAQLRGKGCDASGKPLGVRFHASRRRVSRLGSPAVINVNTTVPCCSESVCQHRICRRRVQRGTDAFVGMRSAVGLALKSEPAHPSHRGQREQGSLFQGDVVHNLASGVTLLSA